MVKIWLEAEGRIAINHNQCIENESLLYNLGAWTFVHQSLYKRWQVAQSTESSLKHIMGTLLLICTSIIINHNASSSYRGSTLPPHFSWYAFSIRSAKVTPAQWQMNHYHPYFQQCYWSVEWFRGGHSF